MKLGELARPSTACSLEDRRRLSELLARAIRLGPVTRRLLRHALGMRGAHTAGEIANAVGCSASLVRKNLPLFAACGHRRYTPLYKSHPLLRMLLEDAVSALKPRARQRDAAYFGLLDSPENT